MGWETCIHLSKKCTNTNFFVITRQNNRQSIIREIYPPNLKFIYYDLPQIFLLIKKTIPFVRTYYYLWMVGAVIKLWRKRKEFQIIHHITFVNDWFPSIFILLKNKNNIFIWGPIGSNKKVDAKFIFKSKHKIFEYLKSITLNLFRRTDLFFWLCKFKADLIIGTSPFVENNLKLNKKQRNKFINFPAIGIKKENEQSNILKDNGIRFTVLSVGQLIYIKNFRLTIKSFQKFLNIVPIEKRSLIKLQIIGNGNQEKELKSFVKELRIQNNVDFLGYMNQNELMKYYDRADVFLFPTLENAGFVILEAMSKKLPVIALNYGGPKNFIKQKADYQLANPDIPIKQIEEKMCHLLYDLFVNRGLRIELGNLNQQTVFQEFTWTKKADTFINIYNQLLSTKSKNYAD